MFRYIREQKPYILAYVYDLDEDYSYAKIIYIYDVMLYFLKVIKSWFFSKE